MPTKKHTLKDLINLHKKYPEYFLKRSVDKDATDAEKEIANEIAKEFRNCCQMSAMQSRDEDMTMTAADKKKKSMTGAVKRTAYIDAHAAKSIQQKEFTALQWKIPEMDADEFNKSKTEYEERQERYRNRLQQILNGSYQPLTQTKTVKNAPGVIHNRNDSSVLIQAQLQHFFYQPNVLEEFNFYKEAILSIPKDKGEQLEDFFSDPNAENLMVLMLQHFNSLEESAKKYYAKSKDANIKFLQETQEKIHTRVAKAAVAQDAQQELVERISKDLEALNKEIGFSYQRSVENVIANHLAIVNCGKDLTGDMLITFRTNALSSNNKNPINSAREDFLQRLDCIKTNILTIYQIPLKVVEEFNAVTKNNVQSDQTITDELTNIAADLMGDFLHAKYIDNAYPDRVSEFIDKKISAEVRSYCEELIPPENTQAKMTPTAALYQPNKKNTFAAYLANVPKHLQANAKRVYENDVNIKNMIDEFINWQSNSFNQKVKECIIAILECCGNENYAVCVAAICDEFLTSPEAEKFSVSRYESMNSLISNLGNKPVDNKHHPMRYSSFS